MEQHNIDSRFKEGLGNLNRQPSADAWARLQKQMAAAEETPVIPMEKPAEKKKPVWWLSIAAAVVLLLTSVAVFRGLKDTNEAQPGLATVSPKASLPQPAKREFTTETTVPKKTQIAMISEPKSADESTVKQDAERLKATVMAQAGSEGKIAAHKTEKTVKTAAKEPKAALSEKTNPEPQLAYQEPQKVQRTPETVSDLSGAPIEVIVKLDRQDEPAVAAVAVNQPKTDSENKPSVLKNIFKNLKNGESLNLAQIGLIQDTKLAFESSSLHTKVSKVFQN